VTGWETREDCELAAELSTARATNLETYRRDRLRIVEDQRRESETLEAAYSRRQVIELVQNGADALSGTTGGRVEVVLTDDHLYCANEGSPLTPTGLIEGLLYSGMSPKQGKEIGRFGIGFKSVLAVTSRPMFLSRTISVLFSESRSRFAISAACGIEHERVPILRLPWQVDPYRIAAGDPCLEELMEWASSVVVLPLDRPDVGWLAESMGPEEMRHEFLLFSPQVHELRLEQRRGGTVSSRTLTCSEADDSFELSDNGSSRGRWRVRRWTHTPSERARTDGGERFGRPEIDLAWAVPSTADAVRSTRELWSFFPIPAAGSSLPGILNSGWKLSSDRHSIVRGPLNEELLGSVGEHLLHDLRGLADPKEPGRVLALLPRRPERVGTAQSAGWAADHLQRTFWLRSADHELVPAADGSWRRGAELRLHPAEIAARQFGPAVTVWIDRAPDPGGWVHPSVMPDDRWQIARALGASDCSLSEWLEVPTKGADPLESSVGALHLALMLPAVEGISETATQAIQGALRVVHIVLGADGNWLSPGDPMVGPDAPSSHRPHPGVLDLLTALREHLGISADPTERQLRTLANVQRRTDNEHAALWELVHRVGTDIALEILREENCLAGLAVRTVSGAYATKNSVLLPGTLLPADEDPRHVVDIDFHGNDEAILLELGVGDTIDLVAFDPAHIPYDDPVRDYYAEQERAFQAECTRLDRGRPQGGMALLAPAKGPALRPTLLEIYAHTTVEGRARFTSRIMEHDSWRERWRVRHRSRAAHYPILEIDSPSLWAIRKWGALPTSLGTRALPDVVGPKLTSWRRFLPVVDCNEVDAHTLGLPETLRDVGRNTLSAGCALAAEALDLGPAPETQEFLCAAANAGADRPPCLDDEPVLTVSKIEFEAARIAGTRVWLCDHDTVIELHARWGLQPLQSNDELLAMGDLEAYPIVEYLPEYLAVIPKSAIDLVRVVECEDLHFGTVRPPVGQREQSIYIRRDLPTDQKKRLVLDQLRPDLTAEDVAQLQASAAASELEVAMGRAREAADDADRLAVVLGSRGLTAACRELDESCDEWPDHEKATALLTVHGPAVLQAVRPWLPIGLGAPSRWAGGPGTVAFVSRLGFPASFAGRRSAENPDQETSIGPVEFGPLHDFQTEIANSVVEILRARGAGIIDLPTGAGKTRVAIEAVLSHARGRRRLGKVLWVAERQELCEQAVVQWLQLWRVMGLPGARLDVLRFWGSRSPRQPEGDNVVIVAGRQQLASRLDDARAQWIREADLLIIDEAHHTTAATYLQIKGWVADAAADSSAPPTIGLSATPFRSDVDRSAHLARLFDRSLVTGSLMGEEWKDRIRWLQERRVLAEVERRDLQLGEVEPTPEEAGYLTDQPNLDTGLDRLNQRLAEDDGRNKTIVEAIRALDDPEWPVIVFAGSVAHAKRLAILLTAVGIAARPLWGAMPSWARQDAIERFRSGEVRVLTNYNVLSEGFDAPETQVVVIARIVGSDGLFLQMLGRGMRGFRNGGTDKCLLITTGEHLPQRFDPEGRLDLDRHEWLWRTV
jgi:superfamily II DNA or RNA helicase